MMKPSHPDEDPRLGVSKFVGASTNISVREIVVLQNELRPDFKKDEFINSTAFFYLGLSYHWYYSKYFFL